MSLRFFVRVCACVYILLVVCGWYRVESIESIERNEFQWPNHIPNTQISDIPPIIQPHEYEWLLIMRVHSDGAAFLPLPNVTTLEHIRLQLCRPIQPNPKRLPPSARRGVNMDLTTTMDYPTNECMVMWSENWIQQTNSIGAANVHISVPMNRLNPDASLITRHLIRANTLRLTHRLRQQCHPWTPSDLIWMSMNYDREEETIPADSNVPLEWDPQGIAAVSINPAFVQQHRKELETREILWPFNPADPLHELSIILLPSDIMARTIRIPPQPHPFIDQPHFAPDVPFVEAPHRHWMDGVMMQRWWSLLWMMPVTIICAVLMLEMAALARQPERMKDWLKNLKDRFIRIRERFVALQPYVRDTIGILGELRHYLIDLVDWRWFPSSVHHWPASVMDKTMEILHRAATNRAVQFPKEWVQKLTTSLGLRTIPSPSPVLAEPVPRYSSSHMRPSHRRSIEVGRGSPFTREESEILDDEDAAMKRFRQLMDESRTPTPSEAGEQRANPAARLGLPPFHPASTTSVSPFGRSATEPFESAAWREFERGHRQARRQSEQLQREQQSIVNPIPGIDEYDRALPDDEFDWPGKSGLKMPVWKAEEIKQQQTSNISPVAYAIATTRRSDGGSRAGPASKSPQAGR